MRIFILRESRLCRPPLYAAPHVSRFYRGWLGATNSVKRPKDSTTSNITEPHGQHPACL